MTTLSLNGLTAVSVTLFHPWTGAWSAEVDFDLDTPIVPSGAATLKIGNAVLVGTIDPDASGRFGVKAKARVIGGHGGWHRAVGARQFHNDAGVTTTAVVAATAAEVGETVVVVAPKRLGVDFMRSAGPASRVLAGLDWWVSIAGTTTVGPRVPIPATPDVDVLSWEPQEQRAELATDTLIMPGTVLTNEKFGTATVRDVEQRFGADGARATAWCGPSAAPRLVSMLTSLVKERGGVANLKTYRYRVVAEGIDGRLSLVPSSPTAGIPAAIAIPPWYGLPGCKATALPGMEAAVVFLDGDPSQPVVLGYKGVDNLATGVATQASMAPFMTALAALNTTLTALIGPANPLALTLDPTGALTGAVATAATALTVEAENPATYSIRTKAS